MPIKKAAMKALRQTKKNAMRNKLVKETVNRLFKQSRRSLALKKMDEAKETIKKAVKAADKAVRAKILKQNTANRLKSRLMKELNSLAKK